MSRQHYCLIGPRKRSLHFSILASLLTRYSSGLANPIRERDQSDRLVCKGKIMSPGVVKTEKQYKECLNRIDYLMQSDPEPDSEPGQELEILAALVEDYESNRFKFSLPGVIDAVLFRMKETCLRQKNSLPSINRL